jgi:hypothetical protein
MSTFFNDPTMLYIHDKLEALLRHMIRAPILRPGLQMSEELRERFLRGPDQYGLDLAALIIQMGRDHGLGSYVQMREACGLKRPESFEELAGVLWGNVDLEQVKVGRFLGKWHFG